MKNELLAGDISKEAKYKLEFVDGKLQANVKLDTKLLDAEVMVKFDGSEALDAIIKALPLEKLKAAIPGGIDDALIDGVLEGVKKMVKGALDAHPQPEAPEAKDALVKE